MAELKLPKPEKKSVLKEPKEDVPPLVYSVEEEDYIRKLQTRLENTRTLRDQTYNEFDGMSLNQYYWENERKANTMLEAKKNRADTVFQSGTLRTKMLGFVSTFQGLNLKADISAFRKDEVPLNILGNAMEDIIEKTEEMENDEEKRMIRQYELLKQGTVFLEELWERKWEVSKKITKGFIGMIKGVAWNVKKALGIGHPMRRVISLLKVYLGDIREYFIENQPFIYTVEVKNRTEVKAIYGNWERWKYVSMTKRAFSGTTQDMVHNAWRLTEDINKDQVEVIKYQDKPNNEFQIILNGVIMLPMGYPFPWGHGEYSIVQQNLEPIRHDFAYGKSFIFKNKNLVALLDMMMRLAVLKTQKSFIPPYLNLSGRVVSKTMFMPGQITQGFQPGQIVPVSDKETQGVTTSEFNMIQEVIKFIDTNTASQTFSGQKERGQVTATQIIELQRQAKIMMGILILAASLLEKKLAMKRLMILLQNWFNPLDKVVDETRKVLRNRYRIVSRARTLDDRGQGVRMTVLSEELPAPEELKEGEDRLEEKFGKPFEVVVLNPKEIQSAKFTWMITVTPKEKRSSELSKLMFGAMIDNAVALGLPLDPDYIQQRFAEVWEEDANKMFRKEETGPPGPEPQPAGTPKAKLKSPRVGIPGATPAPAGALR